MAIMQSKRHETTQEHTANFEWQLRRLAALAGATSRELAWLNNKDS